MHNFYSVSLYLQRKKWLQDVLDSLAENDPVKAMLKDLQTMGEESNDLETKEEALENLELHVQSLDLANGKNDKEGCNLLKGLPVVLHISFVAGIR